MLMAAYEWLLAYSVFEHLLIHLIINLHTIARSITYSCENKIQSVGMDSHTLHSRGYSLCYSNVGSHSNVRTYGA